MKSIPKNSILLAALLALACALPSRADESTSSVAFSDPGKTGTLKIRILHGEIVVHGADVTPDGASLYVAEGQRNVTQEFLRKVNLATTTPPDA